MLKIKKGVHLKHLLKKYEFHKGYNKFHLNNRLYGVEETDNICIDPETRHICLGDNLWISSKLYYSYGMSDTLYDLIKADLVEKV
jgi:hypothetical protein